MAEEDDRAGTPGKIAGLPPARTRGTAWIAGAAAVGFLVPFLCVDLLALPRGWFVLAHLLASGALVGSYFLATSADDLVFRAHVRPGLIAAAVAGAFTVGFVVTGPSSSSPSGWSLAGAIIWLGVAYGSVDAMLLTVMPVIAARRLASQWTWPSDLVQRLLGGILGLVASLLVTAAYHLGFPEFQGAAVTAPLIGNAVFTLAYLLSSSPLAPLLGHIAMHVAAIVHALESSVPLPPHYG